jgi:hypothetical protein
VFSALSHLRKEVPGTFLLVFFVLVSSFCVNFSRCSVVRSVETAEARVYVVALDGLAGHLVTNVSRAVDGIMEACRVNEMWFYPHYNQFEIRALNVSVTVVDDWAVYKAIVESGSNVVIVNVHGETVPVPSGYTKEEWVDEIADAMALRNVTWVHTGGYPFYYYQVENGGEHEWGVAGFKRLMSHMGMSNVTCWSSVGETERARLHENAIYGIKESWALDNAMEVELWRPLNGSVLKGSTVSCIWGNKTSEMTGAAIKFAASAYSKDFGFYVHIGTRNTFTVGSILTDGDYCRGYVGAAQAIYTSSLRNLAVKTISEAEYSISKAKDDGRTSDLETATRLIKQSKESYELFEYYSSIKSANDAIQAASSSTKPSLLEAYGFPVLIVGSVSAGSLAISIMVILLVQRNRNSKRKGERR